MKKSWLMKLVVVVAAAAVFVPLMADWVVPGRELRLAIGWLDGGGRVFPIWGWLVQLVGDDITALAAISVVAALACVGLVASAAADIIRAAVREGETGGAEGAHEFVGVESAAVLLAGLGFAFAPQVLTAATRISPLMVSLVPILGAVAILARLGFRGRSAADLVGRFRSWKTLVAVALLGCAAVEFVLARRIYLSLVLPALVAGLGLSLVPALVIGWCVKKRYVALRLLQLGVLALWAIVVAEVAFTVFGSGQLVAGREGNRIIGQILANVEGKAAIISEGPLDDILRFRLPKGMKGILLARSDDAAYGRELADWVRGVAKAKGEGRNVEDLVFAAELGPRVLVDEWAKLDREGFEANVASVVNFFPAQEKLAAACDVLGEMREDDPLEKYLRRLLIVCGNALGSRKIETGDPQGAWDLIWTIFEKVDPDNYTTLLNLSGLIERGLKVPEEKAEIVKRRRGYVEAGLKGSGDVLRAAQAGGRPYVDPSKREKALGEMRTAMKKRGPTPGLTRFVEAVTNAPKDRAHAEAARNAIRTALTEGRARIGDFGGQLVALDLALGDGANAERDSIEVLKVDRRNPTANATLGMIAGAREDYERSACYLERAIATGKASVVAKNDYAFTLMKLGRLDEAEPYAREAVKAHGEMWNFRETLTGILARKGQIEEAEKELAKTEELAAKAGLPKGSVYSIELDRAIIQKKKGDLNRFKMTVRSLRSWKNLSDRQKREIEEL